MIIFHKVHHLEIISHKVHHLEIINQIDKSHSITTLRRKGYEKFTPEYFPTFAYSGNIFTKFAEFIYYQVKHKCHVSKNQTAWLWRRLKILDTMRFIMRSILMSHVMVIKNPQNVHKICFEPILMTPQLCTFCSGLVTQKLSRCIGKNPKKFMGSKPYLIWIVREVTDTHFLRLFLLRNGRSFGVVSLLQCNYILRSLHLRDRPF